MRSRGKWYALHALAMTVAMIASVASAAESPANRGGRPPAEAARSMVALEVATGSSVASPAQRIFRSDASVNRRHGGSRHGHAGGSRSRRYRCAGGRATCR